MFYNNLSTMSTIYFLYNYGRGKMLVIIQTIKLVQWGPLHLMFLDSLLADLSDNPIVFPPYKTKSGIKFSSQQ